MAGGFKRIEDYDVVDPVDLPDDAVVYTVLPSESTPALIDRNWTWAGFKAWLTTFVTAVTAVVSNTAHRSSDGSSHTFIDQDVKVAASPTFATINTGQGDFKLYDETNIFSFTATPVLGGFVNDLPDISIGQIRIQRYSAGNQVGTTETLRISLPAGGTYSYTVVGVLDNTGFAIIYASSSRAGGSEIVSQDVDHNDLYSVIITYKKLT